MAGSRLLVLAGAILGSTLTRASGWQLGDPQHLTLKLGALGNTLAAAAVRWDSLHYLAIAQHGYSKPGNTVFFPLYPLLVAALDPVTSSYIIAGGVINAIAFSVALFLLHRLTRDEFGDRTANAAVLLLAFSPVSLFFTALYTESLFLLLSLCTFMLARRERLGWACMAAAGAALTYAEGVLLIAPLAIFYWQQRADALRGRSSAARAGFVMAARAAPLALPAVALAGFLVYLHSRGYGWLAPSSGQRSYGRHFAGPLAGTIDGVRAALGGMTNLVAISVGNPAARQQAFQNLMYLAVLVISFATLVGVWRRLPKAYAVFSTLYLLVCVSSPVATAEPLTSLDRFVLVLFPLWQVAANWLSNRGLLRAALAGCAMLSFVFALEFGRWAFFG